MRLCQRKFGGSHPVLPSSYLAHRCFSSVSNGSPLSVTSMKRNLFTVEHGNELHNKGIIKAPPEEFSRKRLALYFTRFTEHVLQEKEDDTKAMLFLVKILHCLLMNYGADKSTQLSKSKLFSYSKKCFGNQLKGKTAHCLSTVIMGVDYQHTLHLTERNMSVLTPVHLAMMKSLFKMCVSSYTEVRVHAQRVLAQCAKEFLFAGLCLVPDILPLLKKDEKVSHEQFKGALHIILLPEFCNAILRDWGIMNQVFPAFVQADHSEKLSIVNLMNKLTKAVLDNYTPFTLPLEVPDSCISAAALLHSSQSKEELLEGDERLSKLNQDSLNEYKALVNMLVDIVKRENLQWRYSQHAVNYLLMLIHPNCPFPVRGTQLMVDLLNNDSLKIRKVAIRAVTYILQQQKRKRVKVPVLLTADLKSLTPGEREDNKWLCYDGSSVPRTTDEWDSYNFIDKTHWGYYTWPKTLFKHAPYSQQPKLDRSPEELSEGERTIFEAFSSKEFVEKIIFFLSLEENKGKDHFSKDRFTMFKLLFRNFGPTFVPLFKPHLTRLAVDSQESSQRCAAEIIAGLLCGSKNWNFKMVEELREFLEPLLKEVLVSVTPETVEDWAACFSDISANRDPRRIHWVLELLMINPLSGTNGAFMDACHLYLLQSLLAQQEWRTPSLQSRLLDYLKPHFIHPFKNVRERIGSMLAQMHAYELPTFQVLYNPRRKDTVRDIDAMLPSADQIKNTDSMRLSKTVLAWLVSSYHNSAPELFYLLAKMLPFITNEDDDEIGPLIKITCTVMSHIELIACSVDPVLQSLHRAIASPFWRVRVPALLVLQILVFENLFLFQAMSQEVTDTLLKLMEDAQLEVRELAASTLSGLVQCGFIDKPEQLKELFIELSQTKLPKKSSVTAAAEDHLLKRHCGVLGLAALVEACPYSVPDWLPEVIDEVAQHLHDPMPIQETVKKTMSEFKRTHYDSWSEHKQKFTDDQLVVLADLLISPSYYA